MATFGRSVTLHAAIRRQKITQRIRIMMRTCVRNYVFGRETQDLYVNTIASIHCSHCSQLWCKMLTSFAVYLFGVAIRPAQAGRIATQRCGQTPLCTTHAVLYFARGLCRTPHAGLYVCAVCCADGVCLVPLQLVALPYDMHIRTSIHAYKTHHKFTHIYAQTRKRLPWCISCA